MRDALIALNRLVADSVIPGYAIAGAIGASFYLEAQATEDLDVFVIMPPSPSGLLSLSPVYEALKLQGGEPIGEHIRIGGWKVQILPAYKPLVEEALAAAIDVTYEDVPTRVLTAEHLCAICLDTARPKDFYRVSLFIDDGAVDLAALSIILKRFGLEGRTDKVLNWPHEDSHGQR
jgi:hypothetical protein